jgi:hypothetical protein
MKKGRRVVVRYPSTYEKALPNGSLRCRMELHRASSATSLRTRSTANPQSPRDPRRDLLRLEKRMPVASTPARLPSMAHRLPLLQKMAYRWYLGEDQPGSPRTPTSSLEEGSSAQRGRGGFPVVEDHRGGRRRARLRRGKEGQGPQTSPASGHRGFRPHSGLR